MVAREYLVDQAREVFRSFGFMPIDTPALEYLEILAGKGSDETDRQIYRFQDHGGRAVGLRFDLTVPLARFVAEHAAELTFPFKRYHIGTVWRGERPQRGRYREFAQCDFDTIGTLAVTADIEMILVIHALMTRLNVGAFSIRVNHRGILNGFLDQLGLTDQTTNVLRAIDKLDKFGPDQVASELREAAGAQDRQINDILTMMQLTGDNQAILRQLDNLLRHSAAGQQGIGVLGDICAAASAAGVTQRLSLDVSIARGLDYYTGTVVETTLSDLPAIGSVCSGGRYDNLVAAYSSRQLPGIGASLGLDRMLTAMEELGMLTGRQRSQAVFLPYFAADHLHEYLRLASGLREQGFAVELFPEPKKIGQQLKYATERGFRVALIMGESEFAAGMAQIKNLDARTSCELPISPDLREIGQQLRAVLDQ
jgi:histidyl-tRNA synthetase